MAADWAKHQLKDPEILQDPPNPEANRWDDRETVRWLDIEHRWIFPVRIGISVDINHQLEPGDLIIKHGVQSPLSNAMLVVSPGVSWQNPMLYSDRLFVGHWETRDFPHGFHPVGNHHFPHVL